MDIEQEEVQFLGLFDIYKESYKLIFKLRKILIQIVLTLILPLCFIFIAQVTLSIILFRKFNNIRFGLLHTKLPDLVSLTWPDDYILLLYSAFILAFSLLSTSTVVYTVACTYTSRRITFKKVMSVVPKLCKRLTVNFLSAFFAFFTYYIVFTLIFYARDATVSDSTIRTVASIAILIVYAAALVHLSIVWQLANIVSILEDSYGVEAMIKSMSLIRGKLVMATAVFFKLIASILALNFVFWVYAMYGIHIMGMYRSLGFGVLCLSLPVLMIIVFGSVVQTVLYLACKSYHHQNIDKSELSNHLEVLGDYVPLMTKDVRMEAFDRV
ncbi:hypothetical protein C2S53_012420 [Perilla frutescens var. hirtella]|uniref:Uncharacterized protein n=1 Tax=Perilla frutescens var. hirtella TaxID=608512 RepID=A0AAD4PDH0_PERFH|nr:hypothetical protein C2S53_012420 [Perilla frutescens var. hirtella]